MLKGREAVEQLFLFGVHVAATQPRESMTGTGAPFMVIRSGGMYAARSNSMLLPISSGVCPKGAREMMKNRGKDAQQSCSTYLTRWHATKCPGAASRSCGAL